MDGESPFVTLKAGEECARKAFSLKTTPENIQPSVRVSTGIGSLPCLFWKAVSFRFVCAVPHARFFNPCRAS